MLLGGVSGVQLSPISCSFTSKNCVLPCLQGYVSANKCRHALLEHHFTNTNSEEHPHKYSVDKSSCGGMCDVCKHRGQNKSTTETDLSEAALRILKVVKTSGGKQTIIDLASRMKDMIEEQALWDTDAQVKLKCSKVPQVMIQGGLHLFNVELRDLTDTQLP